MTILDKILEIDERIRKLRLEIANAGHNGMHEAAAAESIIDKLVAKRSALQTVETSLSRNNPKSQQS